LLRNAITFAINNAGTESFGINFTPLSPTSGVFEDRYREVVFGEAKNPVAEPLVVCLSVVASSAVLFYATIFLFDL